MRVQVQGPELDWQAVSWRAEVPEKKQVGESSTERVPELRAWSSWEPGPGQPAWF